MVEAPMRVPTTEEFAAYSGAHCHQLWRRVGPDWFCPCCLRSKFQILCWTQRSPGKCVPFWDWMAQLHEHHDHALEARFRSRFEPLIICDQCNSADGIAKEEYQAAVALLIYALGDSAVHHCDASWQTRA